MNDVLTTDYTLSSKLWPWIWSVNDSILLIQRLSHVYEVAMTIFS